MGLDQITRSWKVTVSYRGLTPDEWDDLDDLVIEVQNHFRIGRTEVAKRIFDAGLEFLTAEIKAGGTLSTDAKVNLRIMEKRKEHRRKKRLVDLYEVEGAAAVDWATQENIPEMNQVLTEHTVELPDLTWAESTKLWLSNVLSNGPIATRDAFEMALASNVIDNNPKERNRLSQLAKREGYTSNEHYGVWERIAQTDDI
jgi:hypothetical protein